MSLAEQIYNKLQGETLWRPLVPGRAQNAAALWERGNRKQLAYIFPPGASIPSLVVKFSTNQEGEHRVAREAGNLDWLQRHANVRGIPDRFLRIAVDGVEALVMPYYPGTPMSVLLAMPLVRFRATSWQKLLEVGAGWLLELQQATRAQVSNLETFLSSQRLLSMADQNLIEAVSQKRLPAVAQHGDFNPANILVDPSGLRVVDWEWAALPGLPLVDLFNFTLRSSMLRHQLGRRRRGLPTLQDAEQAFRRETIERAFLSRWMTRFERCLEIPSDLVNALFVCFLRHTLDGKAGDEEIAQVTPPEARI